MSSAVPIPLRTTSLVGRKRTRGELETASFGTPPSLPPRRTKSTSDATRLREKDASRAAPEDSESGMDTPLAGPSDAAGFINGGYKRTIMRQFVRNALERSTQGDDGPYQELLSHFATSPALPAPDFTALLPILQAITSSISLLSPLHHSSLVRAILAIPWAISPDERFVKAYTAWCGVLCSSRAEWVSEVVVMAVKGLRWQQRLPAASDAPTISRALYHTRHQLLLTHLLSLIPTLPTILSPVLVKNFPHKRESEVAMSVYVRNVLDLVEVCPEVAVKVWEVVIDRMIRIDVEIQIELEDLDEDDEIAKSFQASTFNDDPLSKLVSESLDLRDDELDQAMADAEEELDIEDIESEQGSVDGESVASEKELDEARYKRLQQLRTKVDALSLHFLRHLERVFVGGSEKNAKRKQLAAYGSPASSRPASPTKSGKTSSVSFAPLPSLVPLLPPIHRSYTHPEGRLQHFQTLLSLFDRLILPTLHCRRAQFIVFWCCSLSPAYTDLFLGLIVSRALFEQTPAAVSRIAAASYIASFVSRAKYIDDQQTKTVVGYLTAYIDGILTEVRVDPQAVVSSNGLAVFYTVCQALMMIFCFRWKALRSETSRHALPPVDSAPSFADDMEMDEDEAGVAEDRNDEPEWIPDLKILQKAIHSQLNPLMACFPGVVDMFAKVADLTKFMFCYSIMSANRNALENSASSRPHVRLASTTANGNNKGNAAIPHMSEFPLIGRKTLVDTDLDQFFPFDPYDLPRSRVYVDKLYRHWDEVALPEMKGEDDDESSVDSDDEDERRSESSNTSNESTTPENTRMPDLSDRPPVLTGSSGVRTASGRRLPAEELRSAQQISTSLEGMKLTSPPKHTRSLGIIA
ncbi:DNA independent RNA polymerase I transcription factor [Naganishia albida]|nr:DNA independent RNA polymerase I transcription factor [Naganishia albida]